MKDRTAATRGRTNRAKGANAERELAKLLDGATIRARTLTARRVPNVGAMAGGGWGGDVLMGERCSLSFPEPHPSTCLRCQGTGVMPGSEERIEVKRRASGSGFTLLERWIAYSYALVLRQDRGEWLVVIRLSDFAELRKGEAE